MSLQRKQNLSSFDVSTLVNELQQTLKGSRLNTVTNISKSEFLFKFHRPSTTASTKIQLYLDSGIRANLTDFIVSKVCKPTTFVLQLRQQIQNLYVVNVQQYYFDRIIVLSFGRDGEVQYQLILELFGKGNVILTQPDFRVILTLNAFANAKVQENYLENNVEPMNINEIRKKVENESDFTKILQSYTDAKGQNGQLRYVLAKEFFIGGAAAAAVIRVAELVNNIRVKVVPVPAFSKVYAIMKQFVTLLSTNSQGYIYFYDLEEGDQEVERSQKIAEFYNADVLQVLPGLYKSENTQKYETFNECIDKYFTMLATANEFQSFNVNKQKQLQKQDFIDQENVERIQKMERISDFHKLQGQFTLYNSEFLERFIVILNTLFQKEQLTWSNIGNQIQISEDKVFKFIEQVDVINRIISVKLVISEADCLELGVDYQEVKIICSANNVEEENQQITISVPVKLNSTVGQIAKELYSQALDIDKKIDRTVVQKEIVNKKIKKMSENQIKNIDQSLDLQIYKKQYRQFWFEQFHWFISSTGLLVVGGRDAQSNELLVKRFMGDEDIFVHADIQGASCVIIKAPIKNFKPDLQTLQEAGTLSVCHSKAWNQQIAIQIYWVKKAQISKTAPTGMYISTGSFVVRGKRNFFEITQVKLGAVGLFRHNTEQDYIAKLQEKVAFEQETKQQVTEEKQEKEQITAIQTKKSKVVQVTQKDAKKEGFRLEQKQKRKERLRKIAEQKFQAKLRRLEKEGRGDEVKEILRKRGLGPAEDSEEELEEGQSEQEEIQVGQPKAFCIICQSSAHFCKDCEQYKQDYFKVAHIDIKNEDGEVEIDEELKVEKTINFFNLTGTKEEQFTIMIAPWITVQNLPNAVMITQGGNQKGQVIKQMQAHFSRIYKEDDQLVLQIRNLPEHLMMFAIPNGSATGGPQVKK